MCVCVRGVFRHEINIQLSALKTLSLGEKDRCQIRVCVTARSSEVGAAASTCLPRVYTPPQSNTSAEHSKTISKFLPVKTHGSL